jgi:glycosyltransferase involved in cell wall biosynthesis
MNTPTLAVFTPELGAPFIERHVRDLAPGGTVVVAGSSRHPLFGDVDASCPTLFLDRWALDPVVRLRRRVGASAARLQEEAVEQFLRRHHVEVALGEFLDAFSAFVPLLERLSIPYVVQGHGIDVSARLRDPAVARSYGRYSSARAVLTRCEPHRQRLLALGLPADLVQVNHGGVLAPDEVPARGPQSATRFLAIARMDAKKGPIYLLEAFRRALAKRPQLKLDCVSDGPLMPAAQQFVDAFRLTDRVRLHGRVSEAAKNRLLSECGVLIQHSVTDPDTGDEEGLPASIQEAMAWGLMVVSTRHAGIPEAVTEGETGLLVDERDVDGMACALAEAPGLAARMGAAGRVRALAEHTWPREAERLKGWLFGRAKR